MRKILSEIYSYVSVWMETVKINISRKIFIPKGKHCNTLSGKYCKFYYDWRCTLFKKQLIDWKNPTEKEVNENILFFNIALYNKLPSCKDGIQK